MRILLLLFVFALSTAEECDKAQISGSTLSASSQLDDQHSASHASLSSTGAWCPKQNFSNAEYLEIQLNSSKLLRFIKIEGELVSVPGPNGTLVNITRSTERYALQVSENRTNWISLKEISTSESELQVTSQFIRLIPLAYTEYPCLKVEVFGCEAPKAETCENNNGGCSDICKDHAKYCIGGKCFFNCLTSFMCTKWITCECPVGYKLLTDKKTCVDINECEHRNGGCNHFCKNSQGSYKCVCRPGYQLKTGSQHKCVDVNECQDNNGGCNQQCINSIGSYQCKCDSGYEMSADNHTCTDIDECLDKNGGCSDICYNLRGSYICQCPIGYKLGADQKTCEDVNECDLANGGCEMFCENSDGSYHCSCKPGYKLKQNKLNCEDIDECSGENMCDEESTNCYNYQGGYYCNCKAGYKSTSSSQYKCLAIKCPVLVQAVGTLVTPQRCLQANQMKISETCKFSCDVGYELPDPSQDTLTCKDTGYWDSSIIACQGLKCPVLSAPANGLVSPSRCSVEGNRFPDSCYFSCNDGYTLKGPSQTSCTDQGAWDLVNQPSCVKDSPKPWISCPANIITDLRSGKSEVDVSLLWREPKSNVLDITIEPAKYQKNKVFPYKVTTVKFIAKNDQEETAECQIQVTIRDKEMPKVTGCPANVYVKSKTNAINVMWTEPQFHDNVGITFKSSSKSPGDVFSLGSHNVRYEARDDAGNSAECNFRVYVTKLECPPAVMPEGGSLACSNFGTTKWCTINCSTGKKLFTTSYGTSCSSLTMIWTPYTDCVDYQPKPASGNCPTGSVPQTSSSPWSPAENICVNCQKGMFYDSATMTCQSCPLNEYSNTEAATKCTPCAPGYGTLKTGQKSCIRMCDPGQSSPSGYDMPKEPCFPCCVGYYQDERKATSCKQCPVGLSTITSGKTSLHDCGAAPKVLSFEPSGVNNKTEGEAVTLTCLGDGTPEPVVDIYKVLPVPDGLGSPVIVNKVNGKVGKTYSITSLTEHDAGTYECVVKNSFGEDKKHTMINVIPDMGSGSGSQ